MTRKHIMPWIAATAMTLLCSTSSALAADGHTPAAYGWFWITFGLVYLTRRRKIGGWLFYYYFQVYAGVFLLFIILAVSLKNYQPSAWEDKALYTLFMISTLPFFMLKLFETIVASLLLFKNYRTQQFINYLKYVLLAEVVVEVLSLFIDFNHFTDSVPFTIMGGVVALIWYLYFRTSFRVYCVLSHPDWHWNYEEFKKGKISK